MVNWRRRRRRRKERVFDFWAVRDGKRRGYNALQEKFLEGEKTSLSLSHPLSFHSWALLYYNYNYNCYRKQ
jgi:hypothetical protein